MQFLHLSPATRSTVAKLIESGAPVIPEQKWSNYPCPKPLYDGTPISYDEETDDAIRAAVALSAEQKMVTVMFPVTLPGNASRPATFDAGFTVVADKSGRLHSFQCVLSVKGLRRFNSLIVDTPDAMFLVISVSNVTAWDLQTHGRATRAIAR